MSDYIVWTEHSEGWELRVNNLYAGNVYAHPGQKPYGQTWDGRAAKCVTVQAAKNWLLCQSRMDRVFQGAGA